MEMGVGKLIQIDLPHKNSILVDPGERTGVWIVWKTREAWRKGVAFLQITLQDTNLLSKTTCKFPK